MMKVASQAPAGHMTSHRSRDSNLARPPVSLDSLRSLALSVTFSVLSLAWSFIDLLLCGWLDACHRVAAAVRSCRFVSNGGPLGRHLDRLLTSRYFPLPNDELL